ncbi:hypothetical protein MJG53_015989 [Ovis ammon polii x Ovis aries]|uniref:Uncharacterized protein n=1 Tax=Ovis ammon polii x Ovis aries TaxID=2918886 RepID=A0ACB9UDI1_9CETA|nr:hypothetical protein MJG53_015989 [Ovis ammon polii x Ovis aries]
MGSVVATHGLVALRHMEASQIRDRVCVSCIGRDFKKPCKMLKFQRVVLECKSPSISRELERNFFKDEKKLKRLHETRLTEVEAEAEPVTYAMTPVPEASMGAVLCEYSHIKGTLTKFQAFLLEYKIRTMDRKKDQERCRSFGDVQQRVVLAPGRQPCSSPPASHACSWVSCLGAVCPDWHDLTVDTGRPHRWEVSCSGIGTSTLDSADDNLWTGVSFQHQFSLLNNLTQLRILPQSP